MIDTPDPYREALLALAVAVIPRCVCGQFATYHVKHRYAEPHHDCDDCRVVYVKKCWLGTWREEGGPPNLNAPSLDTADSWGELLPHAAAVRRFRQAV